jgi:hypothetical protein
VSTTTTEKAPGVHTICDVAGPAWVPAKLRILLDEQRLQDEKDGYPDDPPNAWQLDGYDPDRRLCTYEAEYFATHAEAVAAIPAFLDGLGAI